MELFNFCVCVCDICMCIVIHHFKNIANTGLCYIIILMCIIIMYYNVFICFNNYIDSFFERSDCGLKLSDCYMSYVRLLYQFSFSFYASRQEHMGFHHHRTAVEE